MGGEMKFGGSLSCELVVSEIGTFRLVVCSCNQFRKIASPLLGPLSHPACALAQPTIAFGLPPNADLIYGSPFTQFCPYLTRSTFLSRCRPERGQVQVQRARRRPRPLQHHPLQAGPPRTLRVGQGRVLQRRPDRDEHVR